jgi:hypothetical protein
MNGRSILNAAALAFLWWAVWTGCNYFFHTVTHLVPT